MVQIRYRTWLLLSSTLSADGASSINVQILTPCKATVQTVFVFLFLKEISTIKKTSHFVYSEFISLSNKTFSISKEVLKRIYEIFQLSQLEKYVNGFLMIEFGETNLYLVVREFFNNGNVLRKLLLHV